MLGRLLRRIFLSRLKAPRDAARWAFSRHAEKPAFIAEDGRGVTFAELGKRVFALAAGFRKLGLAPGDRVAFLLPNCPEFVEIRLACHEAGLVAVPLVWDLSPRARLSALDLTSAGLYIFDPALDGGAAALAGEELPGLRCVPLPEGERSGLEALAVAGAGPSATRINPSWPATINFTSGTTGEPKGVVSTHAGWMASVRMMVNAGRLAPQADERFLHAIPLATAGWGPVLPCLLGGVTGLLVRRFDAAKTLELAERERATRAFLTPSQIIDWLDDPSLPSRDLSRLRALIYGTAPLAGPKTAEALSRIGPVLQQGYGLAEVLPPLALLYPEEHDPAGSPFRAGRVVRDVEVRVVDAGGADVPPGTRGLVLAKSPTRTPGYWRRPELTEAALAGDFFRTGDVGYVDAAGYLNIVGRASEAIDGLAPHPREVEEAAHAHPAVKECALLKLGGRPTLVYSLRRGQGVEARALGAFVAERAGLGEGALSCLQWTGDLPRSAAGKIVRGQMVSALGKG